jgi:GABA(A) receptor-associated protein
MSNTNDSCMISLQQSNIKKTVAIDFTKSKFNDHEIRVIKKEVELIREKYPNYIPILVRSKDNKLQLNKNKYLVGGEITVGQFMFILRKKIPLLKSEEAIYLFINNTIPLSSSSLNSIYESKKDIETGMLLITVCKENTFGKN